MNIRILRSLTVIGVLVCAVPALAIYTPNPAARWQAKTFSLMADFNYDSKDLDPGPNDLDRYGFFARPSFALIDNVSLYGRLGVMGADDVDAGFAGGFGIQGAYEIPSAPEWAVGAAVDFFYWSGEIEGTDEGIDWVEFQIAQAVSYELRQIPGLVPYAGLAFDFVDAHGSISEDDAVGLMFGSSYDAGAHLRLEAQARILHEAGIFVSAGYRF